MHELSVTESIIKICCEEAEKNNLKNITKINLKIGELSSFVPQSIQYYFDIISKDTKVQGAVLNVEKVPIKIHCNVCGEKNVVNINKIICPKCYESNIEIIEGREFLIHSVEGE